uniref:Fucosyltransferase n=1 Tax=Rhabditophanes sp. KR3021 TaxID=114890 RepID=A0AC35U5P3_9BILA
MVKLISLAAIDGMLILWNRKKSRVAFFVSNCLTRNNRHQYADQISMYYPVDKFGKCGEKTVNRHDGYQLLKNNYKYYLAFENGNCRDYVTEKFFINALQNQVIPIVLGPSIDFYKKISPPNSFIHVSQFKNAHALVEYLKYLDRNSTAYQEYFEWNNYGSLVGSKYWCRICNFAQDMPNKIYHDIENWWKQKGDCNNQQSQWDLYVNEFWEDPALQYDYMRPCKGNLTFDYNMWDEIWIPNTCFINSKSAQIHSSPFRNVFLMVFPNGSLWSNWRIKSKGPCDINLRHFPMDSMTCFLTFTSYNYNIREVRMNWNDPLPVQIYKEIELPDFTLMNFSYVTVVKGYAAGDWDELTVSFTFKRRYGWYLLQGYIPTYLTVFISWIPFYLSPSALAARTMISVNALLAMTFQFGNVIRNLPRVNYVKAIDVWFLSGIGFIFMTLLELAVVGFATRNDESASGQMRDSRRKKKVGTRLRHSYFNFRRNQNLS